MRRGRPSRVSQTCDLSNNTDPSEFRFYAADFGSGVTIPFPITGIARTQRGGVGRDADPAEPMGAHWMDQPSPPFPDHIFPCLLLQNLPTQAA